MDSRIGLNTDEHEHSSPGVYPRTPFLNPGAIPPDIELPAPFERVPTPLFRVEMSFIMTILLFQALFGIYATLYLYKDKEPL